ncbi:MAG: GNAT family N-acetyltransferase, partial [Cyanobacteria bacterium P01_D01_bin.14]
MMIREASATDLDDALTVERLAFGRDDEAELVKRLLNDPSAEPTLSLLTLEQGQAVGHILFTAGRWRGEQLAVPISFLAPLAVVPERQRQGIGSQ